MSAAPARPENYEEVIHNENLEKNKIDFPERNIPTVDADFNQDEEVSRNIRNTRNQKLITPSPNAEPEIGGRQKGVNVPENYRDDKTAQQENEINDTDQQWSNSLAYKQRKAREEKAKTEKVKLEIEQVGKTTIKRSFLRWLFLTPIGWSVLIIIVSIIGVAITAITIIMTFMSMCETSETLCKIIGWFTS